MKPLSKEEYWAKILQDLKDQYGYTDTNGFDRATLESFKVMFDMGWDLHQYTQTNELPANMHEQEELSEDIDELFLELPCVFEKLYDKKTKH